MDKERRKQFEVSLKQTVRLIEHAQRLVAEARHVLDEVRNKRQVIILRRCTNSSGLKARPAKVPDLTAELEPDWTDPP